MSSAAATFRVENVPLVKDRIFVITGGNSGIGFEAARVLAKQGGHVVLACRDAAKMKTAADAIRGETPGAKVDEVVLDLASLASIEQAAATLAAKYPHVDVLLNNAGVMALPERKTVDGFEMQFGTNHLGHFALTGRVLPLLLRAPRGRVVTVSSLLHRKGHIDFDAIPVPAKYDPGTQYNASKLANVLFSYELDRRLKAAGKNAIALAVHPGYSATNLQGVGPQMTGSKFKAFLMRVANAVVAQPATMGMLGSLWGATGDDLEGGEYLGLDHLRGYPVKSKSNAESYDRAIAKRLWDVSETLTGVVYDLPAPALSASSQDSAR